MFIEQLTSGCDINSPRQAGLNGEIPDVCKTLETPLHLGNTIKVGHTDAQRRFI